jgi:nicotinate-nucleotide adenylyltransferase
MKLGLLGGTFDPPHLGHLILADRCAAALELDRVLFIPAFKPPHKLDVPTSPFEHRLRLVQAAIAGDDRFEANDMERTRGGISYTVETLRDLCAAHPSDTIQLLMGADSLADLPGWHLPKEIAALSRIGVYGRPGRFGDPPSWLNDRVDHVAGPLIDISSTELRTLLTGGKGVRYLMPSKVIDQIRGLRLYGGI